MIFKFASDIVSLPMGHGNSGQRYQAELKLYMNGCLFVKLKDGSRYSTPNAWRKQGYSLGTFNLDSWNLSAGWQAIRGQDGVVVPDLDVTEAPRFWEDDCSSKYIPWTSDTDTDERSGPIITCGIRTKDELSFITAVLDLEPGADARSKFVQGLKAEGLDLNGVKVIVNTATWGREYYDSGQSQIDFDDAMRIVCGNH